MFQFCISRNLDTYFRATVEHFNGCIKKFQSMAKPWRSSRNKHKMCFFVICTSWHLDSLLRQSALFFAVLSLILFSTIVNASNHTTKLHINVDPRTHKSKTIETYHKQFPI